jgi:predicted MFS family arabinose efflux permease
MLIGGGAAYGLLGLGLPWLTVPGAILGFAAGWGWNGLFSLGVVVENPKAPALATGLTHTGGYLGAATGPLIFGAVAEYHGYGPAWGLTAAAALIGAAAMFAGQRLVGQQEPSA